MKSHITQSFRDALALLPLSIQKRARAAYRRFQSNPHHSGVQFKKVHATKPVYSARVNDDYRAVGMMDDDAIVWFWIGKHEEYERLLKQL
jgi:hypothetical protein